MSRPIPPPCPQVCPSCHTELSGALTMNQKCNTCGYNLRPPRIPAEHGSAHCYPEGTPERRCSER